MKVTAFNSSPRTERGNTARIVESFLNGCREAGAVAEHLYLAKKNISPCLGCFMCWTKTPGVCAIEDDMKGLLEKYYSSDIVIYATPLYINNVSGIMKNFMDRRIPAAMPQFERDAAGRMRHPRRQIKEIKTVVISNSGFPQRDQFDVLKLLFRRLAAMDNTELAAEIYRDEGELIRNSPNALKPVIDRYLNLVKKAGREVVDQGCISAETIKELEQPLIPYEHYIKAANESWDRL